jgi:hypothetical protein
LGAGAGFEPAWEFLQSLVGTASYEDTISLNAQIGAQKLVELREIITVWPKLSSEMRSAVLAIVRAITTTH